MGAIIVYDVTRPTTFEAILKWKRDLDDKTKYMDGTNLYVVLMANKVNLILKNLFLFFYFLFLLFYYSIV